MSTSATIPVFDPQGVLRDIPEDQLQAAVKNGGTPAVKFQAPDKSIRFVPANRTKDALTAGGKLLPFQQQDVKHPGLWSALYDDAVGLGEGFAKNVSGATSAMSGNPLPMAQQAAETAETISDNMEHRRQEGRSLPYRMIAPAGDVLGVNTRGMEDAADQGDVAGVVGHAAAVPAALAATEAAPFATRLADNLSIPSNSFVARGVRAAARGANKALEKAPGTIGGTAGAAVGGYVGGHVGAEIGGAAGAMAGRELLPQVRVPGEGFGFPDRVTGGPEVAPRFKSAADVIADEARAKSSDASAAAEPQPVSEVNGRPVERVTPASPENAPRTLSGDSVLREELTKQPNNILLKIARSRGVDVAQEALLKPSNAVNNRIINKIVEDFSQDELDELSARRLEEERMGRHDFGEIGKEANQTISLQTYFPELKIPMSQIMRTQKAIRAAGADKFAPVSDLEGLLRESVRQANAKKSAGAAGSMAESVAQ